MDTIRFFIPGSGPHTVQPLSQLPTITEAVFIDGYSQAGASPATWASPATLKIEIDGTLAGSSSVGLDIFAPECIIMGLCINRFGSHGIQIATYDWNFVSGNYIGVDITGTLDRGNGHSGVYIYCGDYTGIGYEGPYDRNVIGGNDWNGIYVEGNMSYPVYGTLIRANYIGLGADGIADVGNGSDGIYMCPYVQESLIGGEDDNHFNVIAYNHRGIDIFGWTCYNNAILRNSIYSNDELGIDHDHDGVTPNDAGDGDSGGNTCLNFPVLNSATTSGGSTEITGTYHSAASTDYRIEFFYSNQPDPSGYGEGEVWIGYTNLTTDGSGNASFTALLPVTVPDSTWVTATATDPDWNTSEFSKWVFLSQLQVDIEEGLLWTNWSAFPAASEYWVFGSANEPNFEPDLEGLTNRIEVVPGDQTWWVSPEGVGDMDWNMTYQVIAVDEFTQEVGRTNPAGEFDFAMQ
jgi:hypothetical protein